VRRFAPLLASLLAALALAPGAAATGHRSRPWATVNVCDSAAAPNQMGVRGSMPGTGRRGRMYMRFGAQWWSPGDQRWLPVGGGSVSPWVYAGPARSKRRQAGWTFSFDQPAAGARFLLRGVVNYQWRVRKHGRWRVVRRAHRVTRGGLPGVEQADPPGRSTASCSIV
jgi:hypothetical protein